MNSITKIMFVVLSASAFAASSSATLFFDFGDGAQTTPGNYNNIITSVPQTLSVVNAIDSTGALTTVDLTISGFSVGADTNGTTTPTGAAAIFDPQATRDSAFGQAGQLGKLDFQGLDQNMVYGFTFFASRMATADNLETKFTVNGQGTTDVVFLDAANNTSNVAVVSNVRPDAVGSIVVNVGAGLNNTSLEKLFYLSGLHLVATPEPTTSMLMLNGISFILLRRRRIALYRNS